jgi:hypothetical protein
MTEQANPTASSPDPASFAGRPEWTRPTVQRIDICRTFSGLGTIADAGIFPRS